MKATYLLSLGRHTPNHPLLRKHDLWSAVKHIPLIQTSLYALLLREWHWEGHPIAATSLNDDTPIPIT